MNQADEYELTKDHIFRAAEKRYEDIDCPRSCKIEVWKNSGQSGTNSKFCTYQTRSIARKVTKLSLRYEVHSARARSTNFPPSKLLEPTM